MIILLITRKKANSKEDANAPNQSVRRITVNAFNEDKNVDNVAVVSIVKIMLIDYFILLSTCKN